MATVQELAAQMSKALITDKRNDETEFVKLADGSPEWMRDVIYKAHGDSFPDDTIYEFIRKAASALADYDGDDPEDAINEIEPDIYTHDLTAWLARKINHVQYITGVLEEFGEDIGDGWKLLAYAQKLHIEEVGHALLAALRELANKQESASE